MQKFNTKEADKVLMRLDRKFQRKVQSEAERRQTRRISHSFDDSQIINWDYIFEDISRHR